MKSLNFLLFIIAAISMCMCSKRTIENKKVFTKQDLIRFPVDHTINPYAVNIEYFETPDGLCLLYILDGNNNLLVFDYKSRDMIRKITLEKEGNNGVGKANGFKILSTDSIIISSRFFKKFFLVDSKGIVIKSYEFDSESLATSYTCSNNQQQILFIDSTLILPQNIEGNWNYISKEYYTNYSTTIDYNLNSREIIKSGMGLPFEYPKLPSTSFSFKPFNNKIIYSFAASDSIYIFDNGTIISKYAKSPNVNKLIGDIRKNSSSVDVVLRNKIQSDEYFMLLPDSFRNFIYRFYKIGLDNISKSENISDINAFPPKFGIQVIDDQFETISDVVFPENKYFFSNSFVNKDGLFISVNHPNNPDFNIDFFSFDQFIFQP